MIKYQLRDLSSLLVERRDNIRGWIDEVATNTTSDQQHLVENSPERAYWHHGYQAALDDVISQIKANDPLGYTADKPN